MSGVLSAAVSPPFRGICRWWITMVVVVLAPLTRTLASTIRRSRAPLRRSAVVTSVLAVTASSWGVLMGISPVLQIRQMLRERSSREVSLGYYVILLAGFLLWISYGIAAKNLVLIIPNTVALLVGLSLIAVALRLRRAQ
jgi:MtN3 and saliva related transmembrane protein